jgi:hypothetical protein
VLLIAFLAACNRNQPNVACPPLNAVTLVQVSQPHAGASRRFAVENKYQVQELVDFANGRRAGFSARRQGVPAPSVSATFFNGAQPLLTFGAGENFFSLTCPGYAGVQEANRVQVAEFQRMLNQRP